MGLLDNIFGSEEGRLGLWACWLRPCLFAQVACDEGALLRLKVEPLKK